MMMKMKKILVSLVVVALIVAVFGNLSSLATEITDTKKPGATLKPSVSATDDKDKKENKTENKAEDKKDDKKDNKTDKNAVGAVKEDNKTSNKANKTNKANNSSKNTATGKIPYAGPNPSVVVGVAVLAISAAYAYKKVSDYNI